MALCRLPQDTERFHLRLLMRQDEARRYQLHTDRDYVAFLGALITPERFARLFEEDLARRESEDRNIISICRRDHDEMIGEVVLTRGDDGGVDFTIALLPEARRQQCATEVLSTVFRLLFESQAIEYIRASVAERNAASLGLMRELALVESDSDIDPFDHSKRRIFLLRRDMNVANVRR